MRARGVLAIGIAALFLGSCGKLPDSDGLRQMLHNAQGDTAPVYKGPPITNPLAPYGLADIFPNYNSQLPIMQQWPHVAVTVVHAPPFHFHDATSGSSSLSGCWTLRVRVWRSRTVSDVKQFDWCYPRDATSAALGGGAPMALTRIPRVSDETTGNQYTEGPVPPDGILPMDKAHRRFYDRGADFAGFAGNEEGRFTLTMDALLYVNLADQMGFDIVPQDLRLWFAGFEEAKAGQP
ncbi:hypothetical protein [Nitrospirillum bahiense]|uniref:Uncharacterized protein n=1 Tax=Nitrospirillum amazonense TaxID=28077 RepID=A0A560FHN6_9PROT|nr:hypothetical protein [Nitrospirillum amazonense]TWB21108.1 hypothetical protein FBZ88_11982 [Nitrospirillum amazonense]